MDENEAVVIAVLAVVVAIVLSKLPPTATSQKGKNPTTPKANIIDYTEPLHSIYRKNTTFIKQKTTAITTLESATTAITTITNEQDNIGKSSIVQTDYQQAEQQINKKQQQEHLTFQEIQKLTPTTVARAGYFYQKGRPRPITLTTAIATTSTDEDAVDYPRLRELYRRTKHSLVFLLIFEIDFLNFIVL